MYKKAQAAMEFLMTYGWAILVVLIAIGALAYFGVLSPDRFLPEKCAISTGSGLFCDDFSIDDETNVRINLHNILTEDITGVTITLTNAGGGDGICTNAGAVDVTADNTTIVPLVCNPTLSEKIKADLTIAYTSGGFPKTTTGSITGRRP